MPTLPYRPYPTIDPAATPSTPYQSGAGATPDAFGAQQGAALGQLGQQLDQTGGMLARRVEAAQDFINLTEQDKLSAKLDDELHKQKYGDPTAGIDPVTGQPLVPGFKNRLGSDAIDYIKSGAPSASFNDTVARLAASAPNDRVRQEFLHQSRARRSSFDLSLDEHFSSQLAESNKQVQQAKGALATRDAASGFDDDRVVTGAADKLYESYVAGAHTTDPTVLAALRQKADGDAAHSAITGALGAGDADRARALFDRHGRNLSGEQQATISKAIEAAGEQQRAKDEKQYGEDYERFLNGEGPRPRPPGARTRGGGGFRAPAGPPIEGANPQEQSFLNEARYRESTNRYDLIHPPTKDGQTAKGAYGFLDASWKEATAGTGMGAEYPTADKAPPKVQDANALWFYRKYGATPWAASGPYPDGTGAGTVIQQQGGGIRNLPLATTVNAQLERAATAVGDLKVEVFSGGQPRTGPNRTGSHRHDEGGAADVQLRDVKTGQLLDMRKPADQARMQKFIQEAVAAGATGVGAAEDYMGPHGIHIGGGSPAAWGGDQTSASAPGWVRTAFVAGRAGATGGSTGARPAAAVAEPAATSGSSTPPAALPPLPTRATLDANGNPKLPGDATNEELDAVYDYVEAKARAAAAPAAPAATAPAPAAPAREPGAAPDWAALAQQIRDSNLPTGAKTAAFQKLEERKRMAEFAQEKPLAKYNAQVHAAVEKRTDEIVQTAASSDDPAVHAKARQDLTDIVKWGADTGAYHADKAYEFERKNAAALVTGRAQYLDATGRSEEALAFINQNKADLPPATYQEQVRNLTTRAEARQGERFERELQIGGGPGYVPGMPGQLPQGAPDFPVPLVPSGLQQRLQAIADSELPEGAKKAAHAAALARHQLLVVGQETTKSDLEMAIQTGAAGRPEIEQAYRTEQISPAARTEMHAKMDKIEGDRNAAAAALIKVNNAGNGGAPLDPKSAEDKKALNYHFDTTSAAWPADKATALAIDYSDKYGLIPERFKGAIRGNLHSGDPARVVAAADTIDQLRNRKPQLIGEIGDENDLRLATLVHTYAGGGVAPARAVELAVVGLKVPKLERDARGAAFDTERGANRKEQHDADTTWLAGQLNSFWQPDPNAIDPVMRKEFEEISKAEYERMGNLEAARKMALNSINNVWGRTRVGGDFRYMKQAPENPKFYGVPGLSDRENSAWMNEQLLADIRRDAQEDPANPLTADRMMLVPSSDRTAPDGRPAYNVWLTHPVTGGDFVRRSEDGQPRNWAPDWTNSAEKQRRDASKQREIEEMRQQRFSVFPRFMQPPPGAGLVPVPPP